MANSSVLPTAQQEPLGAQTQWFHVFKAMIDQGNVAKIGPLAFTVYAVIKAHANYSSGMAWPGIERISEKSGVSPAQIKRELKVLEAAGFITKEKCGRSNRYTLREKIQVTDENGCPHVATWDYVPSSAQHAVTELKNGLITGDLTATKIVSIERLNLQINLGGGQNTQINLESLLADLDRLPASTRDKLRSKLNRSNEVIHSSE